MQTALPLASMSAALPPASSQAVFLRLPAQTALLIASIQTVFPVVLFGAIALFVVVGALSMLTRRNYHDQIGQGGLYSGEDRFGGARQPYASSVLDGPQASSEEQATSGGLWSSDDRQLEIRQMLTARSDRLVRQGHAPLDIDAELARLVSSDPRTPEAEGSGDVALAEEVRQLVRARNERRARQGLDALDVETEVQRTLTELDS
jgi:signal transduction histidine kinase